MLSTAPAASLSMPDMMAHASSADAPSDSEVSFADLDNEASVTTPSATPFPSTSSSTTSSSSTEAMQLDMLSQLMGTASNTTLTSALSTSSSDPSIIAMTAGLPWSSSAASPSISPAVLKLESPLLTHLNSKSVSPPPSLSSKKRPAADPLDKEAKARERVLRNRAAAQESRDKKRKYVADIEASNESLQQENCQLLKRLKSVENDNQVLAQRLEALSAQFAQMQQQQLSLSEMYNNDNQPGVGFCQSAVLAKKDRVPSSTLTNSPQQKLAPSSGNPQTNHHSNHNNPQRLSSMTMKTSKMTRTRTKRSATAVAAAALVDYQSAAQNRKEISCRPICNTRNQALTLSSSAAASFLPWAATAMSPQQGLKVLATFLPQLMLNFSILFLISTGARSNPLPLEQRPQLPQPPLPQVVHSFIWQLFSSLQPLSKQPLQRQQYQHSQTRPVAA